MGTDQLDNTSDSFMPGRRKSGKKRLLGFALVVLVGMGGAYFWFQGDEEVEETEPLIRIAEIGDIENTIAATGTLKPFETVEVGAQVSGQLVRLYVEAGDEVEAGDLLAEIDASQQQQRVESSRASLAGQEALLESRMSALELARANADRQRRLMAEDATSQQDFDNAMNQLASAQASLIQTQRQIDQSRASLAIEEQELEYTRIVAPISGTVVSLSMTEGRTLNASQQAPTILTIADLTEMTVQAEISEADIARLSTGMEVYFTTLGGGNRRWNSELRQILPQPVIENNVVLYTGLFDVDNNDGALLPEMTAQVYFVTSAARDVLTVPIGALTFLEGGPASAGAGFSQAMSAQAGNLPGNRPGGIVRLEAGAGRPALGDGSINREQLRAGPAAGGRRNRLATVQVQNNDGTITEQEIMVGLTSRVAAEVVTGLQAGDQVIAGVLQGDVSGIDRDQIRNALRGGFR
ncbi:MAG: efflux transporter periplasmic adaptor subunit [Gammaproteobacteria bacterium]|nr:efflux transporter periplasmic adaptor subunit [Gammaproteobacteria bacterium]|tara:strand:+ start:231128 stop:232525 length:1398 start_codon:yes stop_codon:yes gene_type:complete